MSGHPAGRAFERRLGRLLIAVTYAAVALLLVGVILLIAAGVSPFAGGPALDPAGLVAGLVRLDPASFLWLGLIAVLATPISRVLGAAVGFVRGGEPIMAAVSLGILAVIAAGVVIAIAGA